MEGTDRLARVTNIAPDIIESSSLIKRVLRAPINTCSVSASNELSTTCANSELAMATPLAAQLVSQLAAQNKRKEKARIAARARRSQEANIIMEMAVELHITQEKIRRIDKATIVKLAIDYIKAFEILCKFHRDQENNNPLEPSVKLINNPNSISQQHQHQQQQQQQRPLQQLVATATNLSDVKSVNNYPAPTLNTRSIFAPKTEDMDSHFLIIDQDRNGKSSIVLKPDTEILDEDDLTHLAPQAGDVSISLEVETLDGIVLDSSLFGGRLSGYESQKIAG